MTINAVWQNPAQPPILDNNQIHVWRANLDLPDAEIVRLTSLLSPDEVARANKFRFSHLKARFAAARGILRQLLANYLSTSPCEIQFDYGDRGKPRLSSSQYLSSLQFNISHSQEYALYGFTYDDLIGVDLEYIREMPDAIKIAQRFFSVKEYELIRNTEKEAQPGLFFTLWTAKEAYLKAVGTGLAESLNGVEIDLNQPRSPRLQAIQGDAATAGEWSLYPCFPATDYLGAIAIKTDKSHKQINFWHWHHDLYK